MTQQPGVKVVIVGGGFGGIYTARHLERIWREKRDCSITLISQHNYFLMTPLLFEAGSGVLEARHAVNPIRRMFDRVQFVEAQVEGVDFESRHVAARLAENEVRQIPYDHLVIAVGGTTNTKMIPGSEHGRTFKTLADAIELRNHCLRLLERADVERDPAKRQALLTFVIIGGGLVGVELQGELTEFLSNALRSYKNLDRKELHLELIEGGKRLIPEMDDDLAGYATRTLADRGVNIRNGIHVKQIEEGRVHLPDGTLIETATIVLATGVIPSALVHSLQIEKGKKGHLLVEPTMRSKSQPRVWALGDCAEIPDPEGKPYPPLAQHALREARQLAKNIAAVVNGEEPDPFVYKSKGTLASLGRYRGTGKVYQFKIYGFIAWWVWRSYYLMQMPRLERKIRIMIDWTVALLFKNDIVELDMGPEPQAHDRESGGSREPGANSGATEKSKSSGDHSSAPGAAGDGAAKFYESDAAVSEAPKTPAKTGK